MIGSCVIAAPALERPVRHTAGVLHQPEFTIAPSMVEAMGRTTCVSFSEFNGDVVMGVDVAPPQRWNEASSSFRGFAAGGGSDGGEIDYQHKKVTALMEGPDYALWVTGSNGGGGVYNRGVTDDSWTRRSTVYFGEVQDGGSADPRRAKSRMALINGTECFLSVIRDPGSPEAGIIRSDDSGDTWSPWAYAVERNYTAMLLSPQYDCIYATADNRAGGNNDGVFILTGLGTGTATVTRIDNVGSGAPTLVDVRDVWVCNVGTTDYVYVVVGNAAGADADRGVWRCTVNADPTGGGFNPATACAWTQVLIPGTADRINCIVGYQATPGSTPIFLMATYFKSSTNALGTYTLTPGAGGLVRNFRVYAQRTLDGEAATPTWEVCSNDFNLNRQTYGTDHDHVMTYVGETSNEQSIFGGQSYASQDLAISADGQRIVSAGKSSPWMCDNPWAAVPTWQPLAKGLGCLEGGYASVYVPGSHRVAIADDDRGMYTFNTFGYIRPEWVIAENIDGVPSTNNAMNSISLDLDNDSLLSARRGDGRGYVTTDPWSYDDAFITALYTTTGGGGVEALGAFRWIDSTATERTLVVTQAAIWRDGVNVGTVATTSTRVEFRSSGSTCWLHYPDLGVYRSTNNGATWSLWWNYGIADDQYAQFCGHMAQDATDPNVLFFAFDAGGVWLADDAHTSLVGSGLAGSRPTGTTLMSGGALPSGADVSAIAVDPVRNDLYACGFSGTGDPSGSVIYRLRGANGPDWVTLEYQEYAESCIIPQFLNAYDGWLWISTASNCTLRRLC